MPNKTSGTEILVVDDDKVVALLHKNLLRHNGIDNPPVIFENGQEALDYLKAGDKPLNHFLVFLDLNMPVLNGWKFLKKLKTDILLARVDVVIVTSSINRKDYLKAQKYEHVLDYCRKPMEPECVEKILNHDVLRLYFFRKIQNKEEE